MNVEFDLWPANITIDGVIHSTVRLVVADGHAYAFGVKGRQPTVLRHGQVDGTLDPSHYPVEFTADGVAWRASRGSGCGCGHPLKGWRAGALAELAVADTVDA
jgi:hypothetical protein